MDEEYISGPSDNSGYQVTEVSSDTTVYETPSPEVAQEFAANGDLSEASYTQADYQSYNYDGGIQYGPDTPTNYDSYGYYSDYQTPSEALNSGQTIVYGDNGAYGYYFPGTDTTQRLNNGEVVVYGDAADQSSYQAGIDRVRAASAGQDVTFPETAATEGVNRVRTATIGDSVTYAPTAATEGVNRVRAATDALDPTLPESAVRVDNRVKATGSEVDAALDPTLPESAVIVDNRVRNATAQAAEDIAGGTATRTITSTVENYSAATVGDTYRSAQDPNTGLWSVVATNAQGVSKTIQSGMSQYAASQLVQQNNTNPPGAGTSYQNTVAPTINQANFGPNASFAQLAADAAASTLRLAQQQSTVAAQRNQGGTGARLGDWRVRLRLAPHATYLYKDQNPGILSPLRATDGVIFPYMPTIATNYSADYSPYDLTHSNYRGYFYKGSRVGEVTLTADFTAQDSAEADYLLAVITFFKACTKMFYGQDQYRGSPPPLVFLTGLGGYQFAENACAISNFAYNLPNDVDYIRARGKQTTAGGQMMWRRSLSYTQSGFDLSAIWSRLTGSSQSVGIGFGSNNAQLLMNGAMNIPPAPANLGLTDATYVPTKMSITLTLLPMMSRQQVSQQFSLQKFANGNLLRGGYW